MLSLYLVDIEMVKWDKNFKRIKMKRYLIAGLASVVLVGCGGTDNSLSKNNKELPNNVQKAIDAPKSNLTQEAKDTLSFMGNEERLAYDVYLELYSNGEANNFIILQQKVNINI